MDANYYSGQDDRDTIGPDPDYPDDRCPGCGCGPDMPCEATCGCYACRVKDAMEQDAREQELRDLDVLAGEIEG